LAEGAGLHAGWTIDPSGKGHATRGCRQPSIGESFLHYAFDLWMRREYPDVQFNVTQMMLLPLSKRAQAQELRLALEKRLAECRLRLHPDKTKDRLLQRRKPKGTFPERTFRFSRLHIQAEISDQPSR